MTLIPLTNRRSPQSNGPAVGGSSLLSFRSEMDRLFDRFFTRPWLGFEEEFTPLEAWVPSIDISENGQGLIVRAELPGVKQEDVQVNVTDRFLSITGEKSESIAIMPSEPHQQSAQTSPHPNPVYPARTGLDRIATRAVAGPAEHDRGRLRKVG